MAGFLAKEVAVIVFPFATLVLGLIIGYLAQLAVFAPSVVFEICLCLNTRGFSLVIWL